jgi:uncharacterized membrane protein YphA (DoxX/SURF4 family)
MMIRIGIGVFFVVSAVLKMLSLDHFELYIYSFHIFNFALSGLVARAVIACEIMLGILLIIKVKYKWAWWLTMLMLVGFSLLLVYVILFRDDTNCHCMGDLVEIKPSLSLIKNLVAMTLLLYVRNEGDYSFRWKNLAMVGVFVVALVPPFVLFPMDGIYNLLFKSKDQDFNETEFNALMADSTMRDVNLDEGNYIVGVIASGCKFCETSGVKMSEFADRNHLDTNRILYFVWGDSTSIENFKVHTKTTSFRFVTISPLAAIRVVNGGFPTYLFMRDGVVEKTADLHRLTEKAVCDHLQ